MAITQVTTVTVDDVTIGLSDTIGGLISNGEFTVENLTPYMICGQLNKLCPKYGSLTGAERSYNGGAGSLPAQFPNVNTGSAGGVTVEFAQNDNLALPHDMYGRNILIYGSLGTPQIYSITNDMTTSNLRVVTSIDFKKIYYDVDMSGVSVSFTRPDAKTITNYQSGSDGKIKTVDNDEDTDISVFSVVDDGNNASWYCLIDDLFPKSNSYGVRWLQNTPQYMAGAYDSTYATLNDGWTNFTLDKTLWRWSEPAGYLIYGGDGGNWGESFVGYIDNGNNFYAYLNYTPYGGTMQCIADGLEYALNQIANAGLKFYWNNTWYKPTASGGYITGYTDNMTEESEWDNITDVTGNTVPVTPPGPTPPPVPGEDDDNTDPVNTAGAPFASGIAHYYAMTADSVLLQHVSEALSTWDIDSSKKDLYRNLISCKLIKPPAPIPVSGSEDFTIYGVVPQYQGAGVKLPVINGNPTNTFGPYSISRKFNDFRDFAPYSKAEIFIPYCGWTSLPSHVIGRSVSVKYYTDIIAATCKAVVFCNNNVVAEAAGIIGLDIPFAAENVGAKMEAANMGLLSSTLGAVQTAVGVGTMVSTKSGSGMKNVTSGLSQVISGCTQISMAGNENWTEINGKAGDGCSLSGVTNIIIKITRPKFGSYSTAPYVPSGYAHNIGYVAMKQTKPGNVTGLLVCDNVDTSGIGGATQRERELIKAYLESGIIVKAAPTP